MLSQATWPTFLPHKNSPDLNQFQEQPLPVKKAEA